MEWWAKALSTIVGTTGLVFSIHKWNESYRRRNEVHPITAFLDKYIENPQSVRQKRVEEVKRQSKLSEKRLDIMYRATNSLE